MTRCIYVIRILADGVSKQYKNIEVYAPENCTYDTVYLRLWELSSVNTVSEGCSIKFVLITLSIVFWRWLQNLICTLWTVRDLYRTLPVNWNSTVLILFCTNYRTNILSKLWWFPHYILNCAVRRKHCGVFPLKFVRSKTTGHEKVM